MRQLAAAGGDLSAVRTGLDRALRLSLAYDLAAISTLDSATMLPSKVTGSLRAALDAVAKVPEQGLRLARGCPRWSWGEGSCGRRD